MDGNIEIIRIETRISEVGIFVVMKISFVLIIVVKKQLLAKQETETQLEEELHNLRDASSTKDETHLQELANNKARFEEEINGVKLKHQDEFNAMKVKLEQLEKENEETKELMEKQKGERKEIESEKGEKQNILIELKNAKEENEALRKELEAAKK